MRLRRLSILSCCGMALAIAVGGCTQTEGKIIPPAPNTLPEGARLGVAGVGGGGGTQKIQGPGIAKATKPSDQDKKDEGKKDDTKKGDEKKPADDKKPGGDDNKDKPKS